MSEPALSDVVTQQRHQEALAAIGVETLEQLAEASVEDLVEADGIGEKTAETLKDRALAALAHQDEGGAGQSSGDDSKPTAGKPKPRPKPEPKPQSIRGLAPGRMVSVRLTGSSKPYPGVIVDVIDAVAGEVEIVALCPPRPQPGGIRIPAQFCRAMYEPDSGELRAGYWRWPERV